MGGRYYAKGGNGKGDGFLGGQRPRKLINEEAVDRGSYDRGRQNVSGKGVDEKFWAYMDPQGEVRTGFSMDEMRNWYELGYFDADLQVAMVHDTGGGKKPKVPHHREFYALRQWFPEKSKAFTFVPKF